MKWFGDKVVLVTGASSGIGRAAALAFAREGAKVVFCARRRREGEETASLIQRAGGETLFVQADVSRAPDVEHAVVRAVEAYGRLDCAFNNAGTLGPVKPITELSEEECDAILGVNLKGVWFAMKYEIRQMLRQGSGAIVNNCSAAGLKGFSGLTLYTASKHGVIGLTRAAALEYAGHGIRINAICPGTAQTPMTDAFAGDNPAVLAQVKAMLPVGRIASPEEIAEAALWLCSDAASFVTGAALPVDGGMVL